MLVDPETFINPHRYKDWTNAAQTEIGNLKGLLHHAVYCPHTGCNLCQTIKDYVNKVVDDF